MTKVNVADSFSPLAERLGDNPKISPKAGCYGDYARRSIEKAFPGVGKSTGYAYPLTSGCWLQPIWIDDAELLLRKDPRPPKPKPKYANNKFNRTLGLTKR